MTVYTRCMIVHGVHICMFESLQQEGLYVGDLLYGISIWLARPLTKNKLWKILQKMGIPDPLTCLLRNLYAGQETAVRTGHGTMNWFQIGKGVCQGCILSPCLFNLNAEYIMRNVRQDEAQAGIKIARRNINNLRYRDDTAFMEESEEELKSLLMKVKEESEKVGLNSTFRKLRSWHPVPSFQGQIDGETMETVTDYFVGLQNHCRWWLQPWN